MEENKNLSLLEKIKGKLKSLENENGSPTQVTSDNADKKNDDDIFAPKSKEQTKADTPTQTKQTSPAKTSDGWLGNDGSADPLSFLKGGTNSTSTASQQRLAPTVNEAAKAKTVDSVTPKIPPAAPTNKAIDLDLDKLDLNMNEGEMANEHHEENNDIASTDLQHRSSSISKEALDNFKLDDEMFSTKVDVTQGNKAAEPKEVQKNIAAITKPQAPVTNNSANNIDWLSGAATAKEPFAVASKVQNNEILHDETHHEIPQLHIDQEHEEHDDHLQHEEHQEYDHHTDEHAVADHSDSLWNEEGSEEHHELLQDHDIHHAHNQAQQHAAYNQYAQAPQHFDAYDEEHATNLSEEAAQNINYSVARLIDTKSVVDHARSFVESDDFIVMTREMVDYRLEEWLNANLPQIVERVVRQEIHNILRGGY